MRSYRPAILSAVNLNRAQRTFAYRSNAYRYVLMTSQLAATLFRPLFFAA